MHDSQANHSAVISVSIAEDETQLRQALAALVSLDPHMRLKKTYAGAEDAIDSLRHMPPDVLLVDIRLQRKDGIWLIQELCSNGYDRPIIVQSVMDDEATIFRALESGAIGYLLKDAPPETILAAIRDAHNGGSPMTASIARLVIKRFQNLKSNHIPQNLPIERLSRREHDVVEQLMTGHQYKEIANTLHISLNTVRIHIRNIYKKLQINSRAELMAGARTKP